MPKKYSFSYRQIIIGLGFFALLVFILLLAIGQLGTARLKTSLLKTGDLAQQAEVLRDTNRIQNLPIAAPEGNVFISVLPVQNLLENQQRPVEDHQVRIASNDEVINSTFYSDNRPIEGEVAGSFSDNESITLEAIPTINRIDSQYKIIPLHFPDIGLEDGWNCLNNRQELVASYPSTRITLNLTSKTPRNLTCFWHYGLIRIGEDI